LIRRPGFYFVKSTSKKGYQKPSRKSRPRPLQKRRASSPKDSLSKLKKTNDAQAREIQEGQEQQTATRGKMPQGSFSGGMTKEQAEQMRKQIEEMMKRRQR